MNTSKSTPTTGPEPEMISPAGLIDHTLLNPSATLTQIEQLCEEAVEWGFASVCIPPVYVRRAAECLYGSDTMVCSVVGFPCGYDSTASKVQQTTELVGLGCDEIDMVIQIGHALHRDFQAVESEILQIVRAAFGAKVKVIIECCFLDDLLKKQLTEIVVHCGAAFIKTSTGFGPSGATLADVRLLSEASSGRIGVKAAGGIRNLSDFQNMRDAGASRIGTSSGLEIMQQWNAVRRGK